MTDAEKIEVIRASMLNIGRLLPVGMELSFYRDGEDPRPRMAMIQSDGTSVEYVFTSHSPIFLVPAFEPAGSSLVVVEE